jgi:hypothetical protein
MVFNILSIRSRLFLKVTIRHSMPADLSERDTNVIAIKQRERAVRKCTERITFYDIGDCLTQS